MDGGRTLRMRNGSASARCISSHSLNAQKNKSSHSHSRPISKKKSSHSRPIRCVAALLVAVARLVESCLLLFHYLVFYLFCCSVADARVCLLDFVGVAARCQMARGWRGKG